MSNEKPNNGSRVAQLLWINTVLTALILPLLGFVGVRLWDSVDSNAKDLNALKIQAASDFSKLNGEISIIKERQQRVLEDMPRLHAADEKIQNQLDEHMNRAQGSRNP